MSKFKSMAGQRRKQKLDRKNGAGDLISLLISNCVCVYIYIHIVCGSIKQCYVMLCYLTITFLYHAN